MAEQEQAQEKTEQPSAKRLKEARKKARLPDRETLTLQLPYWLLPWGFLFLENIWHSR